MDNRRALSATEDLFIFNIQYRGIPLLKAEKDNHEYSEG